MSAQHCKENCKQICQNLFAMNQASGAQNQQAGIKTSWLRDLHGDIASRQLQTTQQA